MLKIYTIPPDPEKPEQPKPEKIKQIKSVSRIQLVSDDKPTDMPEQNKLVDAMAGKTNV